MGDTGTLMRSVPALAWTKVVDASAGVVTALVNATAVEDSDGDIVVPGAHTLGLARVVPKGVWSHDWSKPIAKTLDAVEVMPGDTSLPQDLLDVGAGALRVTAQFNMGIAEGADSFARVKFYGAEQEWSVGYRVHSAMRGPVFSGAELVLERALPEQKAWWLALMKDDEAASALLREANFIFDWDILEYSPVLWGASPGTRTEAVKSGSVEAARVARLEQAVERIEVAMGKQAVTATVSPSGAMAINDNSYGMLTTTGTTTTGFVLAPKTFDATVLGIEQEVNYLAAMELTLGQKGRIIDVVNALLKLTDLDDDTGEVVADDEVDAVGDTDDDADGKDSGDGDEDEVDESAAQVEDDASLLLLYEHQRAR